MNVFSPGRALRIGLVGAGRWGRHWARVLHDAGVLAWVADTDIGAGQAIRERFPDVPVRGRIPGSELPSTDGAVVAVPPAARRAVVPPLLEAGVGVLVEKPLALSEAEASSYVDRAQELRVPLMVGHTFQYSRPVQRAVKALENCGRLHYATFHWSNTSTSRTESAFWNLAPHPLSVLWMFRQGTSLKGYTAWGTDLGRGVVDVGSMTLTWEDFTAEIHVSHRHPEKIREFTVVGDDRSVVCRPTQGEMLAKSDGRTTTWRDAGPEPLVAELREFERQLRGDSPSTYGQDGLWVVALLEKVENLLHRKNHG